MKRCKICKGIGLVQRETPFVCAVPHGKQTLTCMHCENINKGKYTTCDNCAGAGRTKILPTPQVMKR